LTSKQGYIFIILSRMLHYFWNPTASSRATRLDYEGQVQTWFILYLSSTWLVSDLNSIDPVWRANRVTVYQSSTKTIFHRWASQRWHMQEKELHGTIFPSITICLR